MSDSASERARGGTSVAFVQGRVEVPDMERERRAPFFRAFFHPPNNTRHQSRLAHQRTLTMPEHESKVAGASGSRLDERDAPATLHAKIADLTRQIDALKRRRKFGLVWEDKPEQVVSDCQDRLPVLNEIESRKIADGKPGEPTHLLIEGDNYHALSVLNYTHAGKIDVIYIDPPYNTGNRDFIYNDRLVDKEDTFRHSKWLSFMEKRLRLARDLLAPTGVIFISIDDNEQAHLKLLCDQVFNEGNFVSTIIWEKKYAPQNDAKWFSDNHDFILCYANRKEAWRPQLLARTDAMNARYKNPDKDPRGVWKSSDFSVRTYSENYDYPITLPSGRIVSPPSSRSWQTSKEQFEKLVADNRVWFGPKGDSVPSLKRFLTDVKNGITPLTIWKYTDVGHNQHGKQELDVIIGKNAFDSPKPVSLLERVMQVAASKSAIILDFFAGSGTTGHAVLKLNAQDGGTRQFILCTNNENDIAENITFQRLKKVIAGYGKTPRAIPANLRYFKTDFVGREKSNDATRARLVERCADIIRVRENTFEPVLDEKRRKFYCSATCFTAINFNPEPSEFAKFWEEVERKNTGKLPVKLYIFGFSRDTSAFTDEMPPTKLKWEAVPIPESILQVYKRLFEKKGCK